MSKGLGRVIVHENERDVLYEHWEWLVDGETGRKWTGEGEG